MEYTIFILALPVLSFLVLALAGMKMPHKVAGAIVGGCHSAELYHGYRLFRRDTYCRRTFACIYSVELPVAAVH